MEPRIATLLGDSSLERTTVDPVSLLPPPSAPRRRPLPVEPTPVGDDARQPAAPRRAEYIGNDGFGKNRAQGTPAHTRQKSSVPIAEVLNNEGPASLPPPAPFSGRLSDILLDPSQQNPNKRRKVDGQTTPPSIGGENAMLKLPKLPQLPKKATRRPRIPPLLQGLHQPPPLPPEGRLFPPITGEGGGFGRDIKDRVNLRSPAGLERSTDKDGAGAAGAAGAASAASESKAEPDVDREPAMEKPAPAMEKPAPAPANDKESLDQVDEGRNRGKDSVKTKGSKKRNKWSDQETKDLLHGVQRFGIGNWKKILQCPDFSFNQRTAVDLKDRFRTCCPGEGLKQRKPKSKSGSQDSDLPSQPGTVNTSPRTHEAQASSRAISSIDPPKATRKTRGDTHRKGPAELAEMGIQGPFVKNARRERREFSERDDENLMKGFERYGPIWHKMRDDSSLGFSTRHPTDLRDRFRIKFPDIYAKAGYKLKPKDEQLLKDREKDQEEASSQDSTSHLNDVQVPDMIITKSDPPKTETSMAVTTTATATGSNLRSRGFFQPFTNNFPASFDDFSDLLSDDDGDGRNSPITLNRNIFQWADANPSQVASNSNTAAPPSMATLPSDIPMNLFAGMDGMHINPLATLNLPISLTSNFLSANNSYSTPAHSLLLSQPSNPTPNTSMPTGVAAVAVGQSSKHAAPPLLRTPNLPTIVFPHVPVASARSTMHNLPPPADLLSGIDVDVRAADGSAAVAGGFVLDDGIGFALQGGYGSAALAPMVNGGGRGLERAVGEESDRRGS
ncbi:hypothetical protein BS50DRAFT_571772 [Corynespora cassiicola Philippines]|uniref:Myb-like domain-containing protein n=1 Tax=Corynespora cassiicola Philippines TaxID=1448308 RepID=A0A2T2NYR3_CORCC|nr:hypothetical protein BS50DRAFT_571772 [Corynespora cassiicola Philippines]